MKILLCGFKGNTNTSQIIIDNIESDNIYKKLYLVNSFETSANQLENMLHKHNFDLIMAFGQKPKVKSIYLEQRAYVNGQKLTANFEHIKLADILTDEGYKVKISDNAGNYLCNNIFYTGLKYIARHSLGTKMIFIHIPTIKNINRIEHLANAFSLWCQTLNKNAVTILHPIQ